jgi:hypothetical protein
MFTHLLSSCKRDDNHLVEEFHLLYDWQVDRKPLNSDEAALEQPFQVVEELDSPLANC